MTSENTTIIGKKCINCKVILSTKNTDKGQGCRFCLKCLDKIVADLNKGSWLKK